MGDGARASLVLGGGSSPESRFHPENLRTAILAAVVVAIAYYAGARIGFALTVPPHPISVLWPTNALLMAAILLLPSRSWWLPLAGALPAHLFAELQSGVPFAMALGWFLSNCSEALIGAVCIRLALNEPLRFDAYRHVCVFLVVGALVAPMLSTFIDAGLITTIGWGSSTFWELVQVRVPSNALAALIVVPLIMSWASRDPDAASLIKDRKIEAALLLIGLSATATFIFEDQAALYAMPALLYAPLPFLLWAAMRFGPRGTSACILIVASLVIWGAMHGQGPFTASSAALDTRSVQLFLIAVAAPLLMFSAVMTERQKNRKALQASEERSLAAFRAGPDPMAIVRKSDLTIADVNEKWEALFGYARAEAVGRTTLDLRMYVNETDRDVFLKLASQGLAREVPLDMRDRGGRVYHTLITGGKVEIGGAECLINVIRDVTVQKRMERETQEQRIELMHLSRVAMLGELSGALAHELNQPLTAILSNAQAAQRLLSRDRIEVQDLREILADIVSEDKRAGEVIRRLRALFKKGDTQLAALNANDLIADVLALAHGNLTTRDIHVVTEICERPLNIRGDRVQLQQVLLNLVSNACEAMEAPGSTRLLQIKTAPTADGSVQILIVDGGCGIPENAMPALFDPFFTTKSQGLGLGLSISRTIIGAHSGQLLARNNPGRGATFRILLPVFSGEAP